MRQKKRIVMLGATLLLGIGLLAVLATESHAANGETQFTHTCSQPTQNGTDKVTVNVKRNGVSTSTSVDIEVLATDTPQTKATKYATAINAIAGVSAAAALSTVNIGGTGATDEVTKVTITRKGGLTPSGQKKKKTETASTNATTAYFDVEGTASGVSLDLEAAVVRVGTGRGVASVVTTDGMTLPVPTERTASRSPWSQRTTT